MTAKAIGLMMILLFLLSGAEFCRQKNKKCTKSVVPELTEEELHWRNKHMRKLKKVKLNQFGLKRLNKWWAKK